MVGTLHHWLVTISMRGVHAIYMSNLHTAPLILILHRPCIGRAGSLGPVQPVKDRTGGLCCGGHCAVQHSLPHARTMRAIMLVNVRVVMMWLYRTSCDAMQSK